MDFRLTDEQLSLQDAIRTYCEMHHAFAGIAAQEVDPLGGWGRLAELDVFRIALAPEHGGLGLGIVDATVVFEVLGSHLVPGPLVWSALATRFVPELAGGAAIVGGVDAAALAAEPALVEHGGALDALLVLHHDGIDLIDVTQIAGVEPTEPTDPLTPVALVRGVPQGRRVADADTAAAVRVSGTVLTAALLVGLADRAVAAAVAYTGQRHQFGRPVGSFQAIKHLIADTYVRAALARSATYAAAAMVDDAEVGDAARAAAGAKLLATDAAIRNARTCIQVHGGMGFTWEMIPHYLLKRALVLEHAFGTRAEHAEHMATALELEVSR
jgi:alkylation response protein AidB-like acyl-CoA dehydrogenase